MNIQRLPLPFFVLLMISLTFGVGCVEESAFDDEPGDAIVYEQALRADQGAQTQRSGCYVSYDFDGSEGDLYEQEQWAHELLEANPNEKPMMVIVGQDMTITFSRDYDCLLYTSPSPRDLSTSRMPSSA